MAEAAKDECTTQVFLDGLKSRLVFRATPPPPSSNWEVPSDPSTIVARSKLISLFEQFEYDIPYEWYRALHNVIMTERQRVFGSRPVFGSPHTLEPFLGYYGGEAFLALSETKRHELFENHPGLEHAFVSSGLFDLPALRKHIASVQQEFLSIPIESLIITDLLELSLVLGHFASRIQHQWHHGLGRLEDAAFERQFRSDGPSDHMNLQDEPLRIYADRNGAERFLKLPAQKKEKLFAQHPGLRDLYHHAGLETLHMIQVRLVLIQDQIKITVNQQPEIVTSIIHNYHFKGTLVRDEHIDDLFGIEYEKTEHRAKHSPEAQTLNNNRDTYMGAARHTLLSPYPVIRQLFHATPLTPNDVVYDLGSGYGRVLLYGATLFPYVQFKGVELVKARADETKRIIANHGIQNITIINQNVLDVDFSDGTVFYFFNPFPQIMDHVIDTLETIAQQKTIRVVSYGPSTYHLKASPFLRQIDAFVGSMCGDRISIAVFESAVLPSRF